MQFRGHACTSIYTCFPAAFEAQDERLVCRERYVYEQRTDRGYFRRLTHL
jgi:hypothetical protein